MRNKFNVSLVLGFVGMFSVATACGDDPTTSGGNGNAGDSAAGASDGSGGGDTNGTGGKTSPSGGKTASDGGEPTTNGGEPTNMGGHATGKGGEPSSLGGNPAGGNPAGGEPSGAGGDPSGTGGQGGDGGVEPVTCTEITIGQISTDIAVSFAAYLSSVSPNIAGAGADQFHFSLQAPPLYDGGETGTFDLSANGDENYETCARCILVIVDPSGTRKTFYQSEGTLEIDAASKPLGGTIDATITDLKLVEVTINPTTLESTPVPNGACLTMASATIVNVAPACETFECDNGFCLEDADLECDADADCSDESDEAPVNDSCPSVPEGWLCPDAYFFDADCDCGCGGQDLACASTTNEAECEYCTVCTGSTAPCPDNEVNPANTTACL